MSVKDYPNARDCEHGQLRRSCPICAAEADYAALLARHNALVDAVAKYLDASDTAEMAAIEDALTMDMLSNTVTARAEVDRLIGGK